MGKSIVLARPDENLKNSLEVLIEMSFKDNIEVKESSRIVLPHYLDLLMVCYDNPDREEAELLRKNYMIPVFMISEKPQEELIKKYNIYKSIERIRPKIDYMIKKAFSARKSIEEMFGKRHDIFFTGVEDLIKKEIEHAKNQEKRAISSFEAMYRISKKNPVEIRSQTKKEPQDILLERLIADIIPYLDLYEKTGNDEHLREAKKNFIPLFPVIEEAEKRYSVGSEGYELIQFLVGGSTISEQGMRCLVGINPKKKYDVSAGPHGYFFRDIHNRKGIDHEKIAKIRYNTQQHIIDYYRTHVKEDQFSEVGRFPKTFTPISFDNVTYLIQEGIIGPDLEYVLIKLNEEINKTKPDSRQRLAEEQNFIEAKLKKNPKDESIQKRLQKIGEDIQKYTAPHGTMLKKVKEELIRKYIDDLAGWQRRTQKIITSENLMKEPEEAAEYFKQNLNAIPQTYKDLELVNFSKKELELWQKCLECITPGLAGITKSTLVLSQDSSTKNALFNTGKKFPPIDEFLDAVLDSGKKEPSREKIDRIFYHVDTGFITTHFLEDFFHIIDAYEAAEPGASKNKIIKDTRNWYDYFTEKTGKSQNIVSLYLAGTYRNMRRAYLIVKEFQAKNVKLARIQKHSQYTYNDLKRTYQNMNRHHMDRAVIYLDKLNRYFKNNSKNQGNSTEFRKQYQEVASALSGKLNRRSAQTALNLINKLDNEVKKEDTSRKKKAYLASVLNRTMNLSMAKLAKKMSKIKLPMYNTAMQNGDADE